MTFSPVLMMIKEKKVMINTRGNEVARWGVLVEWLFLML